MTRDWKGYPAHLHRARHDRANRVANWTLAAIAAGCVFSFIAYQVGKNDGAGETRAELLEPSPLLAASSAEVCAPGTPSTDLLVHTWTHRGQVIYRECIHIERPAPLDTVPPLQTSALFKRGSHD